MLSSRVDSWLARSARRHAYASSAGPMQLRMVQTPVGAVRVGDSGGDQPCVVLVPDGPNVIEHYSELAAQLSSDLRVVCFDLPGFGFSPPRADYDHSLDRGARAVLGVLDALEIRRTTLAFSCANGFYALRAARLYPERINSLLLSQTPSLEAMRPWVERMIPWPLRVPVLGQLASWAARKPMAAHWYDLALPSPSERPAFRATARHALTGGSCFSLASVVQGLLAAHQSDITDVRVPCTMLWGARDRTHRRTDAQSLHACAPDARIETHDCGHFPDLEQSARFAELLREHVDNYT